MSLGSHNNPEFVDMIKQILIELDLPEILKIAKFKEMINFRENSETGTPRASEEVDYTEYGSFCEDEDEENNISYETTIYENTEYNDSCGDVEDCEIMLSSELSFNSAYKLLDYIEKNGINVNVKMFKKHFDKWIKSYPDLKDLYRNVLEENNFSKNTETVKTKNKVVDKPIKKIKTFIDKKNTEQENRLLKSLEKLRLLNK